MVQINDKIMETIEIILKEHNQTDSTVDQFVKLFTNLINANYDRSDLLRMIDAIELGSYDVNED